MSTNMPEDPSSQCVRNFQMQMSQQASQFRIQLVPNVRHSRIGETTELITRLVDREESLPIRMAPYRHVEWCVHYDGRLVPEHPFHDDVVSHEIGNR